MNYKYARTGAIAVAAVGLSLLSPMGMAAADPKDQPFDLVCDNGQTYRIVTTSSRGTFTPAFATDSTRVFVPVSFTGFSGAIYDTATSPETLVDSFTDTTVETKGSGKQRNTTTCTYSFIDTFTISEADAGDPNDPEYLPPGTYRFEGSGSVVGQITGR